MQLLGAPCAGERAEWPYSFGSAEELFCLAADLSRFDPRLITILARWLVLRIGNFNPAAIRLNFSRMDTPQTVAVIAEFLLGDRKLDKELRFFLKYLQTGLAPVPHQLYFRNMYSPGGRLMERAVQSTLSEYKRWGFLAREAPVIDETTRMPSGRLDAVARRQVLKELIAHTGEVKLSKYIEALGGSISRQQALIDLRSMSGISCTGHGRGSRWRSTA